jgi:hypothetical protein
MNEYEKDAGSSEVAERTIVSNSTLAVTQAAQAAVITKSPDMGAITGTSFMADTRVN